MSEKANAPEKIYLANTECRTLEGWHRKPFAINGVECIEYTRTDASIKKACAYLDSIGHRYIIDAFRKYMEE